MSTTAANLYDTVPKKKPLPIYLEDGELNYKDIVDTYLDFSKRDLANATKIPQASVRYDLKMPKQLQERIKEWAIALEQVAIFFNGDSHKTIMWFKLPNPMLGNISPRDMIRFGRFKKLSKFILESLQENK